MDKISMNDDTAMPLTYYAAASASATYMAQGGCRLRQSDYWAPEPRVFSRQPHEYVHVWLKHYDRDLKACFGDTSSMKKKAEQTLSRRAQLKLCRIVNTIMSDGDKVGHLLKGITEDVYKFLIKKKNLNNPSIFREQCRAFEALKTRKILLKFGRLDIVPTAASMNVTACEDIPLLLRRVVREELVRLQAGDAHYQCSFAACPEPPPY
ncbi:hypothetical protein HPB51_023913 [Rhipicephalus microplus]|uniref:Uncharacterized protein n=1 Tax=Rhipicephalus microplus TaxID=6941 RepID=A0A9J6DXP0_RHIMP|nr:hypothetical protein HPB51_023913 [Rhipicephalus microplus]